MSLRNVVVAPAIWLATSALALAGDSATGTITFKTGKCAVKYGWLVRGPDEMDPSKTVLRIYLSSVDVGAKIKACKTLSSADNALKDSAMVDFGDAHHLALRSSVEWRTPAILRWHHRRSLHAHNQ